MSVSRLKRKYTTGFRKEMSKEGYNPYDGEDVRDFVREKRKERCAQFKDGVQRLMDMLMEEDPLLKKKIEDERIHNKAVAVQWQADVRSGARKIDPVRSRRCRIAKSKYMAQEKASRRINVLKERIKDDKESRILF
jgi:hypothetical protein